MLEKKIEELEAMIANLPEGNIICTRNDTRYKWYIKKKHELEYIPKCNRVLAEQLAKKKYLSLLLEGLNNKKKAVDAYLSKYNINKCSKADILLNNPGYNELLSSGFKTYSNELAEWCEAPYNHNPKYTENLIYKTISGGYVRSKSEVLIDMALHMKGIPFRYECELVIGENTIYPDFTILHPRTRKIYYWEHFGMMDDNNYVDNVCSKLRLYTLNGIVPSIQLITTYETKNNPLDSNMVNNIVQQYFE